MIFRKGEFICSPHNFEHFIVLKERKEAKSERKTVCEVEVNSSYLKEKEQ
jgi:hypothetical protein